MVGWSGSLDINKKPGHVIWPGFFMRRLCLVLDRCRAARGRIEVQFVLGDVPVVGKRIIDQAGKYRGGSAGWADEGAGHYDISDPAAALCYGLGNAPTAGIVP